MSPKNKNFWYRNKKVIKGELEMSIRDRVIIGDGYRWEQDQSLGKEISVMTYSPIIGQDGQTQKTPDGSTIVESVGGVKIGSTGTIVDNTIDVHKSYLHNAQEYAASIGGTDRIQLIPVMLDQYQRIGWFPIDNIRIIGTSVT